MTAPWIAALSALFAWWFFTGAILLVVRKTDADDALRRAEAGDFVAHGRNVFLSVPLLALGAAGLMVSSATLTVGNVYISFISVLLIWGWVELAFLSGVITGPEKRPCPDGLQGMARFTRAWHTVSHHEILLVLAFLGIVLISSGAENTFGLWTYFILFAARISAKLNLFFGVPRINLEFVPLPLAHIKSYFTKGPITFAFPLGVTFLSIMAVCFAERLVSADTAAAVVGFSLLTALSALAALEHWLMVVPLPDAKLWRWMLPDAPKTTKDFPDEL